MNYVVAQFNNDIASGYYSPVVLAGVRSYAERAIAKYRDGSIDGVLASVPVSYRRLVVSYLRHGKFDGRVRTLTSHGEAVRLIDTVHWVCEAGYIR